MSSDDAPARLGRLRALCKFFADGGGRERYDELTELAGGLIDDGFLDGQQYAAFCELARAVHAGAPGVPVRARACAAMI